ncbi:MAG: hypothetical protein AB7S71_11125 [Dongiaceae bacterium]
MSRPRAPSAIEWTEERFSIKPGRLAADTAYGSAPTLHWRVDKQIAPHIPVIDKSKRDDGTFSREDFAFDKERDVYTCPAGKALTSTRKVMNDDLLLYRASKLDCDVVFLAPLGARNGALLVRIRYDQAGIDRPQACGIS